MSNGVSAVGPIYKAASVRVNKHDHNTWLTARREGDRDILGGEIILDDINDEVPYCFQTINLWLNHSFASYGFFSFEIMGPGDDNRQLLLLFICFGIQINMETILML